jgi:hypothetical protein
MTQGKALIIVLAALVIGFGAGFVVRPVIAPPGQTAIAVGPASIVPVPAAARGIKYFAAHIDEARRVVAGCRDGSMWGDECANAEQAATETEGRDRFKKFMGHWRRDSAVAALASPEPSVSVHEPGEHGRDQLLRRRRLATRFDREGRGIGDKIAMRGCGLLNGKLRESAERRMRGAFVRNEACPNQSLSLRSGVFQT